MRTRARSVKKVKIEERGKPWKTRLRKGGKCTYMRRSWDSVGIMMVNDEQGEHVRGENEDVTCSLENVRKEWGGGVHRAGVGTIIFYIHPLKMTKYR